MDAGWDCRGLERVDKGGQVLVCLCTPCKLGKRRGLEKELQNWPQRDGTGLFQWTAAGPSWAISCNADSEPLTCGSGLRASGGVGIESLVPAVYIC